MSLMGQVVSQLPSIYRRNAMDAQATTYANFAGAHSTYRTYRIRC